jgi:hypothetical protein
MPANGMRVSAIWTAARRPESVSQLPATRGSDGTESLSRTRAKIMNTERRSRPPPPLPEFSAAAGLQRTLSDTFLAHRSPPPSAHVWWAGYVLATAE